MTDNIAAADRFMAFLSEGRLIRYSFTSFDARGRDLACAYAAAVPGARSTLNCPAKVMPQWVADLTPWLDDAGSEEAWPDHMLRYGTALGKWHVLTDEGWAEISRLFRAQCCIVALDAAAKVVPEGAPYWPAVVKASQDISECLLAGREPTKEMVDAAVVAVVAARAARAAAARAAAAAAAAAVVAGTAAASYAASYAVAVARTAPDALIDHFLTLVETRIAERETL